MPKDRAGERLVFLDACCLINLFATGRAEEILRVLPQRFAVARYVAEPEVLEMGSTAADDEEGRISLPPLIDELIENGLLVRRTVSSPDEQRELVRFAVDLDDGEAHTCALAIAHGAQVATDDKKAIRVFRAAWKESADVADPRHPVRRTSELLFDWANSAQIPNSELIDVPRAVARHATFLPPRGDPHFDRWMKLLEKGR